MRMKKFFLILIMAVPMLAGCFGDEEEPKTLSTMDNLYCLNQNYENYRLSISGMTICQKGFQSSGTIDVTLKRIVNSTEEVVLNRIFNVPKTRSDGHVDDINYSHLFVRDFTNESTTDHVTIHILRQVFLNSVTSHKVASPMVELSKLDFVTSLTFVEKQVSLEKQNFGNVKMAKYFNGDGSLLCERLISDGDNSYDGPIPYKNATYTKFYNFKQFSTTDNINFYPVFDEVSVTNVLTYQRSSDNSYITVSAKSGMNIGSIKISPTFNNIPVTKIAANGFKDMVNLVNIEIPTSITYIGDYAFSGCSRLRKVDNVEYVENFGKWCFSNSGLIEFKLSKNVDAVPHGLLEKCSRLKTFDWDIAGTTSNKKFSQYCFSGCTSLLRLPCSEFVKEVEHMCLDNTSSLKYLFFDSDLNIYSTAFKGCSADVFVKGNSINHFLALVGYNGKVRSYRETEDPNWTSPDDYWHYSEDGYPVSWAQ